MPQSMPGTFNNRLLSALSEADLRYFSTEGNLVSFPARQVIYEEGASFDYAYFIEEGLISNLKLMRDGATAEVGIIGTEGMAGFPALLGAEASGQHVMVQIPTTALRVNIAACRDAFEQSAGVRQVIHRFTVAFLDLSAQTAACNRLHSIERRLARWLLMARDRIQSDRLQLTHEFLASMLGAHRGGVTQIAGELQRSGLIRYHRGQIDILDRTGLEATACECYQADRNRFESLL
ncbi:MAG TPA: Crp/Fnr family transcriptional regulator [Stellaceae bacterium]|nr:Crp/Fnr family transcriptional regulator [Stellaceae bacterium]